MAGRERPGISKAVLRLRSYLCCREVDRVTMPALGRFYLFSFVGVAEDLEGWGLDRFARVGGEGVGAAVVMRLGSFGCAARRRRELLRSG